MGMKHGSLFSGIGGFDLAAEWMGWENVFQVEIDKYCTKVLEKNFPNTKRYGDIKEFDGTKYRGLIDIISGGFPCQNISISGRGEGIYGAKSGLWKEYYRIIKEIHPKYAVIENSPNLLKKGFEQILYDLSKIRYDAEWQCFCASDFGFPHERERLFIIAYPIIQRWRGILYLLKRSIIEKNKETNSLDTSCHPFLRFEERIGEPPVLRVDNGLSKRLDIIKRLGGLGNAIVPQIAYEIFKAIELTYFTNE
jgi:DNA (cytosine-5)-methyltransferase 1